MKLCQITIYAEIISDSYSQEQHQESENCAELVSLIPLQLLGWQGEAFDAADQLARHGTFDGANRHTEQWSDAKERISKFSELTLHGLQSDCIQISGDNIHTSSDGTD